MSNDQLMQWFRAILGAGIFGWEVAIQRETHLWVLLICVWLLGGPVEKFISLFTSGRIQINVRDSDPPSPPLPSASTSSPIASGEPDDPDSSS